MVHIFREEKGDDSSEKSAKDSHIFHGDWVNFLHFGIPPGRKCASDPGGFIKRRADQEMFCVSLIGALQLH